MTFETTLPWPPAPDVARQVTDDVVHLLAPNASSWTYEGTNSWVIAPAGGSASVLIDPGIDDPAHLEALRQAGTAGGREVQAVLLTHDHPDHSDGARTLATSLNVPLKCMSPRFADEFLTDGQVLDIDGLHVQVVHTPGHSDDSVCLWMPESRTMLTGDTVLGARSAGVMGRLGDLLESLGHLCDLVGDRDVIALPGHGVPFTDLVDSATRVIEVRARRIAQVRGAIADGDTTLSALIARLYPDLQGSRAMFAASTVISTVEYLADLGDDRGISDAVKREAVMADVAKFQAIALARAKEHAEA